MGQNSAFVIHITEFYVFNKKIYIQTHTYTDIESSWNILNLKSSRTGRTIEFLLKKKQEYTQRGKKSVIKIL